MSFILFLISIVDEGISKENKIVMVLVELKVKRKFKKNKLIYRKTRNTRPRRDRSATNANQDRPTDQTTNPNQST